MSRIKHILLLAALLLVSPMARAQVAVHAKIDSLQLLIGEQTDITLSITMRAKQNLQLPDIKKGMELIPDVEVVDVHRPDTNLMDDGKAMEIVQRYTVTAWDSSFYYLPPFEVKVDGKPYSSKSLALKVYTVDIDTLHLDQYFPPYGVMKPDFSWDDWRPLAWTMLLILLMLAASAVLWHYVKTGKPIVRFVRKRKVLPPHRVAIEEIERIKRDRKWAEEDSKEYYTELTDTLRVYIHARYGFNAMEMTSTEIIHRLIEAGNEEALAELREIFNTADLVKFAKHSTLMGENDANLMAALEYINQTKQEPDPNAKPEPEVVKETDKKRLNQVVAMRIGIALLLLASVVALGWIVWRTIDLLY